MSELVPLTFHKILQSRSYTVMILGTDEKKFAIYAEPQVGHHLQLQIAQGHPTRPSTFDLVEEVFEGLGVKILQVVINDVQDTTYFARLFLEQSLGDQKQILEIDARPSDSVILALTHKIPILCTREVLTKTVAVDDAANQ
jgi:bifunctional DNase/RNase